MIISEIYSANANLERVIKFIKNQGANCTLATLQERLRYAETHYEKAIGLNNQLQKLVSDEDRTKTEYFIKDHWNRIDDNFTKLEERTLKLIDDHHLLQQDQQQQQPQAPLPAADNHSLRLPRIEIAQFDGSYDTWQNFHDIFNATVHSNRHLTGAVKMQHLKAALKGDAATIISALTITDANYEIAWNTLKKRYENKRVLISHHLNKLTTMISISQDSLAKLKTMRDTLTVSVDSLKLLQCPADSWGPILIHILVQKFNVPLKKEWERTLAGSNEYPTMDEFNSFLDNQIHMLENLDLHKENEKTEQPSKKQRSAMNAAVKSKVKCHLCEEAHTLSQCEAFKKMSVQDRHKLRKEKQLCYNCLGKNHPTKECTNLNNCRKCDGRHHTFLHYDNRKSDRSSNQEDQNKNEGDNTKYQRPPATLHVETRKTDVMLATAIVGVHAPNGRKTKTRVLIDSGSELSFVSQSLVQMLGLPKSKTDLTISGLSGTALNTIRYVTSFDISNAFKGTLKVSVKAHVLQKITAYQPKQFEPQKYSELRDLSLADPHPAEERRIDILLGADVISMLMRNGLIRLQESGVIAQATILGWILSGPVQPNPKPMLTTQHTTGELQDLLQKFWEIENQSEVTHNTAEEELCEKIFKETTVRDANGRYHVSLPFKSEEAKDTLGESKGIALAAWRRVEKRLAESPKQQEMYDEFLQEYLDSGHMVEIPANTKEAEKFFYIPHHAVFREKSHTTKIRVVYNASSKTKGGVALNDVLCTGPKLQNEIVDVLTNWRQHRFVLMADIKQMFRQIMINPADQKFQCILWRPKGEENIKAFKLKTVTYGTKPAPFLANRVVKALIEEHGNEYPMAVEALDKTIYVDDVLFGADTKEEAIMKRKQVDALLKRGCLELRKWSSNDPSLLPSATECEDKFFIEPEGESEKRVLGLVWSSKEDAFSVQVNTIDNKVITKRNMLSNIAKLYDPLGLLSPFTIRAKVMMQSLWIIQVDWDDTDLPADVQYEWLTICKEMNDLTKLSIPRFIGSGGKAATALLIGFADASKRAYAAAVYLYIQYETGEVKSNLVRAKSKVAPIKTLSIPRLELSAAVELAKLMDTVKTTWLGQIDLCRCYTDSQIVLAWLSKHAANWHTFVANRVSTIQTTLPDVKWAHVPSKLNPADLNSRGIKAEDLVESKLWWNGPELSRLDNLKADEIQDDEPLETHREIHREVCHLVVEEEPDSQLRCSSWQKLVRSYAYCIKYINILRKRVQNRKTTNEDRHPLRNQHEFRTMLQTTKVQWDTLVLSIDHIRRAEMFIVKRLQQIYFKSELDSLQHELPVSKGSPLYPLTPMIDQEGILRVSGRLQYAHIPFHQRHPIILPRCRVTNMLISHFHLKALHGGLQLTLALLREKFWIIHARNRTKAIISKCVKCVRQRAKLGTQLMSPLPQHRTDAVRAFLHTGVDYAGPFQMKNAPGRGQRSHKVWVAVFVCFATRAIHLEVVNSCTTQCFLQAFKCFVARRGLPTDMYSDNGPNFKGTCPELRRMFKAIMRDPVLHNDLANQGVEWHYIPPDAPHFGGIWEAGVKSFKHHFKRMLGQFIPDWEEMRSLLCQIEACLNSRPLTPMKDEASEDLALTPGHFLIGASLKSIPEPSLLDINPNRLSRWETLTRINQTFWKRWRLEYLQTFYTRNKWQEEQPNFQVGDIALLKDDDHPPCNWGLVKVIAVKHGRDGLVREVTVQTKKTVLTRPITKLCKLPVQ